MDSKAGSKFAIKAILKDNALDLALTGTGNNEKTDCNHIDFKLNVFAKLVVS